MEVFRDFKGSKDMEPGLTTVRIPARKIGRLAGEHISRTITGEVSGREHITCDIELIIRGTTKAVR